MNAQPSHSSGYPSVSSLDQQVHQHQVHHSGAPQIPAYHNQIDHHSSQDADDDEHDDYNAQNMNIVHSQKYNRYKNFYKHEPSYASSNFIIPKIRKQFIRHKYPLRF